MSDFCPHFFLLNFFVFFLFQSFDLCGRISGIRKAFVVLCSSQVSHFFEIFFHISLHDDGKCLRTPIKFTELSYFPDSFFFSCGTLHVLTSSVTIQWFCYAIHGIKWTVVKLLSVCDLLASRCGVKGIKHFRICCYRTYY